MALFRTTRSQYQRVVGDEKTIKAVVRDWGNGHIEIDWSPGYEGIFEWLGGVSGAVVADYVAALERRDGSEAAQRRLREGPAHALIFPISSSARPTSPSSSRSGSRSACTGTRRCSGAASPNSTAGSSAWRRRAWGRRRS